VYSEIIKIIPPDFVKLILVVLFSLLIGLEQRRHHLNNPIESLFGTDRTFTLLGLLGFILYIIDRQNLVAFLAGGAAISILLAVYYFHKIEKNKAFGFTSIITALITYCLAPVIFTQPAWMSLSVVVIILIITEAKTSLFEFSQKFDSAEFTTLAKFLVLIGVVLPLLPDKPISSDINISPYHIWLAVVAISSISYLSHLLRKYIFPKSGILLSGILGGLYSSTATTIILAKKSRELPSDPKIIPAIFLAITMMYLRIFLLALFFNMEIAWGLLPYFVFFIVITFLISLYFMKFRLGAAKTSTDIQVDFKGNPLEFKTSLLFAALFIFFSMVTGYVLKNYGGSGLNLLSIVVGLTDIDPFILNLFQGKMNISDSVIVLSVLNAIVSNNVLKLIYALVLGDKSIRRNLTTGFLVLIISGILVSLFVLLN
jgi:uncharacterized membrane protein (DUF4010 family)